MPLCCILIEIPEAIRTLLVWRVDIRCVTTATSTHVRSCILIVVGARGWLRSSLNGVTELIWLELPFRHFLTTLNRLILDIFNRWFLLIFLHFIRSFSFSNQLCLFITYKPMSFWVELLTLLDENILANFDMLLISLLIKLSTAWWAFLHIYVGCLIETISVFVLARPISKHLPLARLCGRNSSIIIFEVVIRFRIIVQARFECFPIVSVLSWLLLYLLSCSLLLLLSGYFWGSPVHFLGLILNSLLPTHRLGCLLARFIRVLCRPTRLSRL
jgi:hypothetical protein